jgi:hypothetical protein
VRAQPLAPLKVCSGRGRSPGNLIGRVQSFSKPVVRYCCSLVNPWVAAGIEQHSNAFADPILRGIKSNLRNSSGRIERECFCTFQSTRVNRHIMVLVTTPRVCLTTLPAGAAIGL